MAFINRRCKTLNIEIDNFIRESFNGEGYVRLEDLTKVDATECIRKLNEVEQ